MQWISEKNTFILSEKLVSCMQRWSLNRLRLLLSNWALWAEQRSMFACDAKISFITNAFYSTLYSSVYSRNWPFDPMHFLFQITRVLAYWLGSRHPKVQPTAPHHIMALVWTCWRSLEFYTSIKRRLNDIFGDFYFFITRALALAVN